MIRPHMYNTMAKVVSLLKKQEDKGVGDTVERLAHVIGADKIAKAYETVTHKPCGCQKRKEKLNGEYGY
jgi:hypothetical protein